MPNPRRAKESPDRPAKADTASTVDPRVAVVEALAVEAWPPEITEDLDGWVLRFSQGVTRRANSVWPRRMGGQLNLPQKMAAVEQRYFDRGLAPCYHIGESSQPAELDAALAERGYAIVHSTATEAVELAAALTKTRVRPYHRVTISADFDETWFKTYCQAEQVPPNHYGPRREILKRITQQTGYAAVQIDGQHVATGLGVLQREWLGIFSVATCPQFRRRGAATAVIHALSRWAHDLGAKYAYLQVMVANSPAHALYRRAGFSTLYRYHYRELARVTPSPLVT